MDIHIDKDEHRPLLHRREIKATIDFEGATPKREEVKKEMAQKLKVKEELLLINRIYNANGDSRADVIVHVYEDEKVLKETEYEFTLKKHGLGEKKEEKKAEEDSSDKKE